jgi:hypothetical protein
MKTNCFVGRHFHSLTPRRAAVTLVALVALAWSSPAFSGKIHDAARHGDLEKVKALLKHNPRLVFSKDYGGATPLHLAAMEGHKDVAELLLANKAEVNARAHKLVTGETPLNWAAVYGHKDVAELLLANGADVNARDGLGMTPLSHAEAFNHKDVAELLRQHGGEFYAAIQVDGWIDSATVSITQAEGQGINRSYTHTTPTTVYVLRCSGKSDYVLAFVNLDLAGTSITPGPTTDLCIKNATI